MSLVVEGGLFVPPFDRRTAPPVPFSDLLDLLDSPDTPGTTYSFQEPPQQKPASMQAEPIHLSGLLDHHILPTTDDEMMDSDTDLRKDSDPEIEIDTDEVYSNGGGVDLGVNYVVGEDNSGNAHQLYDNDDIMLGDGDTEDTPDEKRISIGSESEPVLIAAQTSALTSEKTRASVFPPDEHGQSNITQGSLPATPEATSPGKKPLHPPTGAHPAQAARALEDQLPRSPVEDSRGALPPPGNLERVAAGDLTGQEAKVQRKENIWSENTPTTIANEPMLQEEYQTNEDAANTPSQPPATGYETEQQGIDADESDNFDPHPVIVQYEQSHVSLFPPPDGVDLPFFVQDVDVCSKSIDVLFSELRNVLDGSVSPEDELVIKVVDYGVEIGEDSKSSHEFSLQYILDLHVRLNLLDGNENPDALRLILFSRPSISGRVNFFLNSANEGIGYEKALCDAISKFNDSDTTPEQGFIEAGENTDFQEITGVGEEREDVSLIPYTDDPDKPGEKDPNIAEEPKVIEQKEKVEENDGGDDDDFDLEYGNDDDTNDGGVVLKADVSESAPHTLAAPKAPPAPISGVIEGVSKSLTVEVTAGVQYEVVPDGELQTDTHASDEGEGSISTVQDDEKPPALEEELIQYEEHGEHEESENQQPSPTHEELIGYEEHGESENQQPSPARDEELIGYEEYGEYEESENQQPSPTREEELIEYEEHEESEIQQPSTTRGFALSPAENRLGYHRQLSHEPPEVEHDRLPNTIGRRDSDFSYFFSSPGPSPSRSPPPWLDAGSGYRLTYLSAQGPYNHSNAYQDSIDEAQKSVGSSNVDQADDAADKQEPVDDHAGDHRSSDDPRIGGTGSYSIPVFEGNDGSEYSHNEEQPGYQDGEYEDQREFGVGGEEGQSYGPEDEQYGFVESYENDHGFDVQPEHPVGSFGGSGRFSEDDQNRYIGEDGELEEEYEPFNSEYPGGFDGEGHPSAEDGYSVDYKGYNDEDQFQPDFEDDDDTVTGEANQSGVALDTDIHIVSDIIKQAVASDEESLLEYDSGEEAARDLLLQSEKSHNDQKRAHEELEQDDSVDEDYHSSRGKLLL